MLFRSEAPKPAEETSAPAEDSSKPADENAAPAPQPSESHRFQNCADVEAAGEAPIRKGHPDFREKFDADGDGVGCEQPVDYENSKKSDSVSLSSGSNDNLGSGSSNASSKSSSSLAKTGASDAMTAAGLGLIALGAGGATIVATRMRKKA